MFRPSAPVPISLPRLHGVYTTTTAVTTSIRFIVCNITYLTASYLKQKMISLLYLVPPNIPCGDGHSSLVGGSTTKDKSESGAS